LEQFKNIEKPKYCTIGTVQKSRKTKNTTLLEQFKNLEKKPQKYHQNPIEKLQKEAKSIPLTHK
jgi:hypothetical protein